MINKISRLIDGFIVNSKILFIFSFFLYIWFGVIQSETQYVVIKRQF